MRIRKSVIEINMFPFLSVLCTVIGVLMLFLLLIISSRIIDDSRGRAPETVSAGPVESQTPLSEADLTKLRAQLAELSSRLASEQAALQELQQRRDMLRELLAIKKQQREFAYGDGLFAGVELSPEVTVLMKPADDVRVVKQPRFIEVDLTGFLVHPQQTRFSVNELPEGNRPVTIDHQPSTEMERFLDQADRRRDREYLVFLIRPSGSQSFDRVRQYLISRYPSPRSRTLSRIDIGWEPFAPEWLLVAQDDPTR